MHCIATGVLLMLALPSLSCSVAPALTITVVTFCYLALPLLLGCFWSALLWAVCSVLVFLRLLQASAEQSRMSDKPVWFRAMQLLSMHDLNAVWSLPNSSSSSSPALKSTIEVAAAAAAIAAPAATVTTAAVAAAVVPCTLAGAASVAAQRSRWLHMSAADRAALRSKAVTLLSMLFDSALFFAVGLALWVSIPLFSAGTHPALSLCIRTGLASCCLLVWLDAIDSFLALMAMAATRCNAKLQRSQADPLHSLSLGEFW
jgi:hypothetical protein